MGRATRATRGVVVGLVVIGLAAAAHLVGGGGGAPTSPGFLVVSLLSLLACALLSHREWTLVRLLVCLTGTQVVFHAVLVLERDAAALTWMVQHPESDGSVHGGPVMAMGGSHAAMMPPTTMPMLLAHAAAVLASTVVLRSGERLLLRLVELLAGLVRGFALAVRPRVRALAQARVGGGGNVTLRTQTRLTSLRRRGPPRAVALTAWSTLPAAASLMSP